MIKKDINNNFEAIIKECVKNGMRNKQIADKLHIHITTLKRYMKKFNIKAYMITQTPKPETDFGNLVFIKEIFKPAKPNKCNSKNIKKWICRCVCGQLCETWPHAITKDSTCKKCATLKNSKKNWKGYKEISGHYFNAIKNGAKSRDHIFDINIEYIWNLFVEQKGICSLSGIKLIFPRCGYVEEQTASLDRIDNSKGYIEGNVRWVHKDINYIRIDLNDPEFLNYIKLIYENMKLKENI